MMGELLIEEVYPVSFVEGVMVVGTSAGAINEGDEVSLSRGEGVEWSGVIGKFHIHQTPDDPPDRIRVSVEGEVAGVVRPGDTLTTTSTGANGWAGSA
jgi:hypothetical protein